MSQAKLLLTVCCILVLSGCSVFGTKEADDKVADEVALLMLDQQILETRMSLAEDKIIVLQSQVDALHKEPQPEVTEEAAETAPTVEAPAEPQAKVEEKAPEPAKSLSAAEAYKQALAAYNAGKYKQAAESFSAFSSKYPKSTLVPNAGYWLGECYYSMGQYDRAILAFQSVVTQYPKHDKAAASLLKSGYSYERLSDKPNARFYLERLLESYPKSEPAPLARAALVRLQ